MSDSGKWWHTFFSGLSVELWLKATTVEQTQHEADFILESLDVPAPAKILDVPCGGGRHSIALASRGYEMTAVDSSTDFLTAARGQSAGPPSKIDWQERDMRDLPWAETFDGAFCFGNSFGYLEEDGNPAFLKSVATALKPGARFVLESGYITEGLLPALQERSWYPVGDIHMLAHRRYDSAEGRLHVDYIFIRGGETQKRSMSARVYSYRELVQLLEKAGFTGIQTFSSLTREPFRLGSNRLLAIATKS
jgi:SAM-dependent methyltransferase